MASDRERLLLILFVSAILVAGGAFAGNAALLHFRAQEKHLQQKQEHLNEAKRWLEERATWEARGGWLKDHPLSPYEGQQTEADFAQKIQTSLSGLGLEIIEQRLQKSQTKQKIVEVGIDLVVQGSLEQVVRWLHQVRKVEEYSAIRQIRLKSDTQSSDMRIEVSVVRFYRVK